MRSTKQARSSTKQAHTNHYLVILKMTLFETAIGNETLLENKTDQLFQVTAGHPLQGHKLFLLQSLLSNPVSFLLVLSFNNLLITNHMYSTAAHCSYTEYTYILTSIQFYHMQPGNADTQGNTCSQIYKCPLTIKHLCKNTKIHHFLYLNHFSHQLP